jgi:WG containing repeat
MRLIILTCIFFLIGCSINSKNGSYWTAFWNEDSGLLGFKDKNGQIKIEPKYTGFTTAKKFDKIIAVMEVNNDQSETYYLTKSGRSVGKDQIYFFDNMPDCESEGFIRFRDKKTDKVGMLNGEGYIVIPPEYNDLTNVRNGFVVALKGARKEYLDNNKNAGCDHFRWVDGREYLVDTKNKIIIENFVYDSNLDFFSIKTTSIPFQDTIRQNFLGVDGKYYSFIDYKKEFQKWLNSTLLGSSFSKEKLIENSYKNIFIWKNQLGWTSEVCWKFIDTNFELIKRELEDLNRKQSDYFISIDGLNSFIYNDVEFDAYYNNCGEAKDWKYPVMTITINHKTKTDFYQNYFEFLRTENGYKLISITFKNGMLK